MNPNEQQTPLEPAAPQQEQLPPKPTVLQQMPTSPETSLQPIAYGGRFDRFMAYIVDSILISLLLFATFIPAILLGSFVIVGVSEDAGTIVVLLLMIASVLLSYWVIRIRPVIKTGQTMGKKLLHLKVVKENGQPLSPGSVWAREIALIISGSISFLFFVFVAPILFTLKRQGVHDMIVGSIVVSANPVVASQPTQNPQAYPTATVPASSNKGLKVALIVGVFVLLVLPLAASVVIVAFSGIQKKAQEAAKQADSKVELVERLATDKGRTVSVLVPSTWKESGDIYGSSSENEKNYLAGSSLDEFKKVTLEILATEIAMSPTIAESIFEQTKAQTLASEEAALEIELESAGKTNCDIETKEYPGLKERNFGLLFTYSCDVTKSDEKTTQTLDGVRAVIHQQDGTRIQFELENAEPNKLDKKTFDSIVASLDF